MDFLEEYKKSHTHPINHLTHVIGIPMIVVSIPWLYFDWQTALALFIVGWILQFVGHAVEGKPPSFFKNPIYLIIGPLWWLKKLTGQVASKSSSR